MAARHAGFAIVSTITEGLTNSLIEAAFANHVPSLSHTLPTPIFVGNRPVTLSGSLTILPPTVTFRARPDNRVGVHFRLLADVELSGVTATPVSVLAELRGTGLVGLLVTVENDQFRVGLQLSPATLSSLSVRVIEGPPLPHPYGDALRSPAMLATVNAALHALPHAMLSTIIGGVPATIRIAPTPMPCGASLFEPPALFDVSFTVSRLVPRVLDQALTIGVDFAGHTQGNPARLGSLFGGTTSVWVRTHGPEGPIAFRAGALRRDGNMAISVNPDALVSLVANTLSPAVKDAFVNCRTSLDTVGITFGTFVPPLTRNPIEGATLRVDARMHTAPGRDAQGRLTPGGMSVGARVTMPLAFHLQTYDGDTSFITRRADYWYAQMYNAEIDLPWWVSAGLVLLGTFVPVVALPMVTVLDGILPMVLGNVSDQVRRTAQAGIDGAVSEFGLAAVRARIVLPGLPATNVDRTVNLLSFTAAGLDAYVSYHLEAQDTRPDRNLTVTVAGTHVRHGGRFDCGVNGVTKVPCAVRLADGLVDPLDHAVRVRWMVRRVDSGAIVVLQDLPYAATASINTTVSGKGGPTGRRIVLDRTDPALMPVSEFSVHLRVYRPLHGRVRELGSSRFRIGVLDRVDRSRPYVFWKGWAAGVKKQSVIHRTAVPGRCSMVLRAAARAQFQYLDALPFPVAELNDHRKEICEYCFFGGPDKYTPLVS